MDQYIRSAPDVVVMDLNIPDPDGATCTQLLMDEFDDLRVLVMSAQPGRVLDVIDVPFGFPRSRELRARGEFAQLTGRVTEVLRAPQPA